MAQRAIPRPSVLGSVVGALVVLVASGCSGASTDMAPPGRAPRVTGAGPSTLVADCIAAAHPAARAEVDAALVRHAGDPAALAADPRYQAAAAAWQAAIDATC